MSAAAPPGQRHQQRPEAAHDRVGETEVAVPVGAGQRDVVADVDHERRGQPRPGRRQRQADPQQQRQRHDAPMTWISAVSSDVSPPDLISAFHEACSSAPNSTAATTGQVSAKRRRPRAERAARGAVEEVGQRGVAQPACLARSSHWRSTHRVVRAGLAR